MQIEPVSSVTASPATTFDLANLQRGPKDPAAERRAVAGQFEAILIRQFLQDSIGSMMGGKSGGDAGGNMYGYMLTDSLAEKIAQGGGMGLSSVISQQLTPRGARAADTDESTSP